MAKHRTTERKRSRKMGDASATAETRDIVTSPYYLINPVGGIQSMAYPLTVTEAMGISAVRRCVTLIANAIAGRPWVEKVGTRILPPSRLVRRPAATMTRREWTWRVVAQMALDDIAHLYMVGGVDDEGVPGSLLPIPRDAISAIGNQDPFGLFPPSRYRISGVSEDISGEAVIPIRSAFWPGVPPHLVGILRMARNTMMSAYSADAYSSRFWQAGGAPTTVITTDQELTGTQPAEIASQWRERRAMGPDFPAVLGKGAHANPYGADLVGASAAEARREMVIDIGRLFGVSAAWLNVALSGNSMEYSNIGDQTLHLQRFTLDAFIDPIQDVISDLLPGDPIEDRRMEIDMTGITQGQQESRYRAWDIATGHKPWMDPEEVRVIEGLAPGAPEPTPAPSAPAVPPDAADGVNEDGNSADAETGKVAANA